MTRYLTLPLLLAALVTAAACSKRAPATTAPPPPAGGPTAFPSADGPPPPPGPPPDSTAAGDPAVRSTPLLPWDQQPLDVINGPDSPLKPAFFDYDSDELNDEARTVLTGDADVLRTYGTWVITVEGHCDERGTAEYNLALGDRRALAAKNYLVSLGIAADRIRTVSYGNEFPFDPAHTEAAWSKNRRAHLMLTSK